MQPRTHPRLHASFSLQTTVCHAMNGYHIPEHVHLAIEGDAAVFMDLRLDEYRMLFGTQARAFHSLLTSSRNGFARDITVDGPLQDLSLDEVLADLLANKLLQPGLQGSISALCPSIPLPAEELLDDQVAGPLNMRATDVHRFFVACLVARWRLRYTSIESTVASVAGLRRREVGTNCVWPAARRLVRIYNALRPLFLQRTKCLFDSLSLIQFLATYNCLPQWVFAIRLEPWAAHCWVQMDKVAFNQDVEDARTYLPIFIV
ncbi:MAG: lasso peptide biosynthesis B2 protein [Steroidobacteraceae bacterium]